MKRYLVLDTETTNGFESPLVYDVGWCIVDKKDNILRCRSYVVKEIYYNRQLMENAFFIDKMPSYDKDIQNFKRIVLPLQTIQDMLKKDCKEYKVDAIVAHNAIFDYKALNTTLRYITTSRCRHFFPYGVELFDTLKMSREVFTKDKDYNNFCIECNAFTPTKQLKMTAEILYRYITKNISFIEEHTALADTLIEKNILLECLRRGAENCKLFEQEYIEIFNGRRSYFVEKRGVVIGAEKITYKYNEIPLGAWILKGDGYVKK